MLNNDYEQPKHKRLVRGFIMKVDVFHLRPKIVKMLGLTTAVHKGFSPLQFTPIERVDVDAPNDFFVLLAVCRKD